MSCVEILHGVLIFVGVPEKKDIGDYLIKIIDENGYILRQFNINVLMSEDKKIVE